MHFLKFNILVYFDLTINCYPHINPENICCKISTNPQILVDIIDLDSFLLCLLKIQTSLFV